MAIKEVSLRRSDVFHVDPRILCIKEGWNARSPDDPENRAHVQGLAASIAARGVEQPLKCYLDSGKYYISDGHCRLLATLIAIENGAEVKSVPIRLAPKTDNEADHVLSQIVLNSGKPLTMLEASAVYKRLVAFGWTIAEIAQRTGKSAASINTALDLQGAPVQVQKLVASGRVSATLATETIKKEGAAKATETLNNAVDAATQKGKTRATKADIGAAPVTKLTAAGKLARLRELIDEAVEGESGECWAPSETALVFADTDYKELLKLLELS